jgi:DNA modification methylase
MPAERPRRPNKLNNLDAKSWLKFQKSWFIHNPPPRRKDVLQHPAKFPETLAEEFIRFFTKRNQAVLDPMMGTGSALVAALRAGRRGVGVELNPRYFAVAQAILADEVAALGPRAERRRPLLLNCDAAGLAQIDLPKINFVITSPPYWDMLHARGAATQKKRRTTPGLDVVYSDDPRDLGNVADYDEFVQRLCAIYVGLKRHLLPGAYLTIIVKNVKKGGKIYPLAWDLARALGQTYALKDERVWCQGDIRLAPYGFGNAWVSNTFHHYCLQFRNEPPR